MDAERKPYQPPQVVFETDLETQAGSCQLPDPCDIFEFAEDMF